MSRLAPWLLGALLPIAGGCFAPRISDHLQCGASDECPPGQSCEDGTCFYNEDLGDSGGPGLSDLFKESYDVAGLGPNLSDLILVPRADSTARLIVTSRRAEAAALILEDDGQRFALATTEAANAGAVAAVSGDLTGDGQEDVAMAHPNAGEGWSLLVAGDVPGTFIANQIESAQLGAATDIAIAELDSEGGLDVLVQTSGDGALIFPGTETGNFAAPIPVNLPSSNALVTAELNGDGRSDLVVAQRNQSGVAVLLQDGAAGGTFPSTRIVAEAYAVLDLAVVDHNGDGRLDLLLLTNESIEYVESLGNAMFAEPVSVASVGGTAFGVADYNFDGRPDVVVVGGAGSTDSYARLLLHSTASTSFEDKGVLQVGERPIAVVSDDVDGDGRFDIAVLNLASEDVTVILAR